MFIVFFCRKFSCIVQLIAMAAAEIFLYVLKWTLEWERKKNVKLRNEKGKNPSSKKKLSIFVSCAFSSSPFYIHLSFQIITLKQSHRTIPNCLAFLWYVCMFFVFISFAVWFRRRFPISFRFQFVKTFSIFFIFPSFCLLFHLVFSHLNVLYVCMLYDFNERIIFSVGLRVIRDVIPLLFLLLLLHFDKSTWKNKEWKFSLQN